MNRVYYSIRKAVCNLGTKFQRKSAIETGLNKRTSKPGAFYTSTHRFNQNGRRQFSTSAEPNNRPPPTPPNSEVVVFAVCMYFLYYKNRK